MKFTRLVTGFTLLQGVLLMLLLVSILADAQGVQIPFWILLVILTASVFILLLTERPWAFQQMFLFFVMLLQFLYLALFLIPASTIFLFWSTLVLLIVLFLAVVNYSLPLVRRAMPSEKAVLAQELVGNSTTQKVHRPSCRLAKRINAKVKIYFVDYAQARRQKFKACKICHPEKA